MPLDVGSMALSPDGSSLALSMEVFPDCPDLQCTVDRLAEEDGRVASGVLYESLFIRHWDTWEDGRRSHIFVLPADGSGQPVDVMAGMDGDSPSVPTSVTPKSTPRRSQAQSLRASAPTTP